jgi:hypothetical protein
MIMIVIGFYDTLDGVTNLKYKLSNLLATNCFGKRRGHKLSTVIGAAI